MTGPPQGTRRRGLGLGWAQVAQALAQLVPPSELERIWLFAPLRQEGREWGTAVIVRQLDPERRRVYTATYSMTTRGRERGRAKVSIDEVGESPSLIVEDVVVGVQERSGDVDPPTEIAPSEWYADDHSLVDEVVARGPADEFGGGPNGSNSAEEEAVR